MGGAIAFLHGTVMTAVKQSLVVKILLNVLISHGHVTQDPDVLDTWLALVCGHLLLWGWPEQTPELKQWYPNKCSCNWLRYHLLLGCSYDFHGS